MLVTQLFFLASEGVGIRLREKRELGLSRLGQMGKLTLIQACSRRFNAMNQYRYARQCIVRIQCAVRQHKARQVRAYLFKRFKAAQQIQKIQRGVSRKQWVENNRERLVKEGQARHTRRMSKFAKQANNFKGEQEALEKDKREHEAQKAKLDAQASEIENMKKEAEEAKAFVAARKLSLMQAQQHAPQPGSQAPDLSSIAE